MRKRHLVSLVLICVGLGQILGFIPTPAFVINAMGELSWAPFAATALLGFGLLMLPETRS